MSNQKSITLTEIDATLQPLYDRLNGIYTPQIEEAKAKLLFDLWTNIREYHGCNGVNKQKEQPEVIHAEEEKPQPTFFAVTNPPMKYTRPREPKRLNFTTTPTIVDHESIKDWDDFISRATFVPFFNDNTDEEYTDLESELNERFDGLIHLFNRTNHDKILNRDIDDITTCRMEDLCGYTRIWFVIQDEDGDLYVTNTADLDFEERGLDPIVGYFITNEWYKLMKDEETYHDLHFYIHDEIGLNTITIKDKDRQPMPKDKTIATLILQHGIDYCTENFPSETEAWLKNHFPDFDITRIVIAKERDTQAPIPPIQLLETDYHSLKKEEATDQAEQDKEYPDLTDCLEPLRRVSHAILWANVIKWFNESDINYGDMTDLEMYIHYIASAKTTETKI